jgi:hypothetical protein
MSVSARSVTDTALPRPRVSAGQVRLLHDALRTHPGGALRWTPVALADPQIPWVGVALPAIDGVLGRRWVWDITVPDLSGAGDALTLGVVQDVCVVSLVEAVRPNRRIHMTIPVHSPPVDVAIPASRLCPDPWTLSLEVGWSAERIAVAVSDWIALSVGRHDMHADLSVAGGGSPSPGAGPAAPAAAGGNQGPERSDDDERFEAAPGLLMDSGAFDTFLTLPPALAGELMLCLQAVHGALGPWRVS